MKPFENYRGVIAAIDRANIDTDQIIPKQFLKSIARTGFGENLFYDWRYLADGKPNPEFLLNRPPFDKASILVARNNFGCGSSREHAVWAIQQFGFCSVIAPSVQRGASRIPAFADIFRSNCTKNALLTIELSEAEVNEIFRWVDRYPGLEATIDIREQRVVIHLPEEEAFHFEIDPAVKTRFLEGLDDIGISLKYGEAIRNFESRHHSQVYHRVR